MSEPARKTLEQPVIGEDTFALDTGDGFTIYGRINRSRLAPAARAIVLCHGLTGHINEHHFQEAKRFFAARGYDVIRFGFYSEEENARQITDCSVAVHVRDLRTVLAHFAPQYQKVFVAGHSYGGLTILMANPENVAAVSLWDASFYDTGENPQWEKFWECNEALDTCLITWPPMSIIVGKNLYNEKKSFTRKFLNDYAESLSAPAQVLAAGANSENIPNQKILFDCLKSEKEFYLIPGAGHCFFEGDTVFDLLEKTLQWFERF